MSNIKDTAKGLYDSLQMSLATMDPGTAKVLGGAAGGLAGGAVGAIGGRRGRIGRMVALGLLGAAAGTAVGGELPGASMGGLERAADDAQGGPRYNGLRAARRFLNRGQAGFYNFLAYPTEAARRLAEAKGELLTESDLHPVTPWRWMEEGVDYIGDIPRHLTGRVRTSVQERVRAR